jgi:hypothetical protein
MATIVTRTGKGSALTYAELDANFTNINAEIATKPSTVFTGVFTTPSPSALAITDDVIFSVEPSLRLDFVNSHRLDPRVAFSRGSRATRINQSGLVEVVGLNIPRFDFDPVTQACRGLLVEEFRINLINYSEHFDQTNWVATNILKRDFTTAAPNGSVCSAYGSTSATSALKRLRYNHTTTTTGTYTWSIFMRAGTEDSCAINLQDSTSSNGARVIVNLTTGAITSAATVYGTATNATATVQAYKNNFYRIALTTTFVSALTQLQCLVQWDVSGNTTSTGTLFPWGAQLELGAFPTSYIPSAVIHTGRASIGTYIDSAGILQTAASGAARLQYNPQNLIAAPLLLLEPARTNELNYSEEFDNAAWNKVNTTVTTNALISPSGLTNAEFVTDNLTPGVEHYFEDAISVYTNQAYTQSIYVKAATGVTAAASFTFTVVAVGSSSATSSITFTQTSGVYTPAAQTAGLITSAVATYVGNGWYRCSVGYTLNGTVTFHALRIYPYLNGLYTGTVVGHYFWGAQLEAGSFITSYIPTTVAPVQRLADTSTSSQTTRAADSATITNISSWYNSVEGTILSEAAVPFPEEYTGYQYILGNFNDGIMLYRQLDSQPVVRVRTASTDSFVNGFGVTWFTSAVNKNALAYESNNFASSNNSSTVTTDTNGSVPNVSTLAIGSIGGTSNFLNGYVQNFIYYPARLSDYTLQGLTK